MAEPKSTPPPLLRKRALAYEHAILCSSVGQHPKTEKTNTLFLRAIGVEHSWGWALQGDSAVGHSRETLGLGTPGRGWALQGDSGVGHSRESLGLGTPASL